MAEILSDDKELIPDILDQADAETAKDLAQALLLNPGFEDLSKRSLLARFIKRFPVILSLVDGSEDAPTTLSEHPDEPLFVSQASFERMTQELEALKSDKIPANSKAIEVARELGDLRENAEYQMAKDDQKLLLARQGELETDLSKAQITDFSQVSTDMVGIGSVVELTDESSGEGRVYSVLGAWDGDPENSILSYKTPLGQNLLGKKEGEVVETEIEGTVRTWRVASIRRWLDQGEPVAT